MLLAGHADPATHDVAWGDALLDHSGALVQSRLFGNANSWVSPDTSTFARKPRFWHVGCDRRYKDGYDDVLRLPDPERRHRGTAMPEECETSD